MFLIPYYCLSANLTLDEAVKEALNNNPEILIAQDKVRQAELKLKGIKGRFSPNLSLNAGYNPITEKYGVGFIISQDLDQFLKGNKREKDNILLELDIAKQELILTEQRIIKEVTAAYYDLRLTKDDLKLKEDIFDSRYKSLEFAQAKFDLGKLSMDELLSRQKEVEEARFALQEARQKLKKAELNLSQLIGKLK
ncbi:MAG: TolC family protein [Candidatus Omnitrophica bacterium]|nr:TolC family protein [Candidatus Omnitrophota bacterium]